MEAPDAARRPASRLWILKAAEVSAAASSSGRCDRVASWATDAVLRVFFVAVWVGTVAGVIPSIAGRWIGGTAWLGAVAYMVAWCVVRYLALLAVPLYLLRSSGAGTGRRRGERGQGANDIVEEVSALEHCPKSRVESRQLAKHLNVTPAGISQTIFLYLIIIGYWMKKGTENGLGKQKIGAVLNDIGLVGASIISGFVLLPKLLRKLNVTRGKTWFL